MVLLLKVLTQELKPIELCSTPTLLSVNSSWNLIGSDCAMAQDHMGENVRELTEADGDGDSDVSQTELRGY